MINIYYKYFITFVMCISTLIACKNDSTPVFAIEKNGEEIIVTHYNGNDTMVIIPNNVTIIGDNAFSNHIELKKIIIPNSVKNIGNWAFYKCNKLTDIILPNNIVGIGKGAFAYCEELANIVIPNQIISIGDNAFDNCMKLKNISVDLSNPKYSSIDGVLFNKTKTILMKYPAYKLNSSYIIPNNVDTISANAFQNCFNLIKISLNNKINTISDFTFSGCTNLNTIIIPNSLNNIGNWAFYGCDKIVDIAIPSNVKSIGIGVFSGCSRLENINVDKNNKNYTSENGVLFNKATTILLRYPIGKTDISYNIPNSVNSINPSAFFDCKNIKKIILPTNINYIGNNAFFMCDSLSTVRIQSPTPPNLGYNLFSTNKLGEIPTIEVPYENYNTYARTYRTVNYSIIGY